MRRVGEEPPETANPDALTRVSFSANAAVGKNAIALSDMQMVLDNTKMNGTLSLPKGDGGELLFELAVDGIVLDDYMAPADAASEGTVDETGGNVEIPVDLIRALQATGKFTMQQATLSGLLFENMELGLNSRNGKLRLFPISADMFEGGYRGDVRIDASGNTPSISVNENIVGVQLSSLAKSVFDADNITGLIEGSFVLSGSGSDLDAIRKDLDGNVNFKLSDGEWQGVDIWHQIRKARALFRQEPAPEPRTPARTEFSEVSVSGAVTNGVLRSNDLLAELPFMRVTGGGTVNFVDATVDSIIRAVVELGGNSA